MKFLRALAVAAALSAGLVALAAGPAQAAGSTGAVTRSAHVPYEGCPAKDVLLTVTLTRRVYGLGQTPRYRVRLHNLSAKACTVGGLATPRTVSGPVAGILGPCRAISVLVEDAKGAQVYPDSDAMSCAALLGPQLGPHDTISVWSGWDRIEGGLRPARFPSAVPPGAYRLVVDGRITIPFALSNVAAPASFTADVASTGPGARTRTAHVAFGGCPARDIVMTLTVAPVPAGSRQVSYTVTVHNEGTTWCGPTRHTGSLYLGICGEISAVFRNAAGIDVSPGAEVVDCPDYDGRGVAPHRSATGSGTWWGVEYRPARGLSNQSSPAPPGRYTLVVAGALVVPFRLRG